MVSKLKISSFFLLPPSYGLVTGCLGGWKGPKGIAPDPKTDPTIQGHHFWHILFNVFLGTQATTPHLKVKKNFVKRVHQNQALTQSSSKKITRVPLNFLDIIWIRANSLGIGCQHDNTGHPLGEIPQILGGKQTIMGS
jgi:hypothetical protein